MNKHNNVTMFIMTLALVIAEPAQGQHQENTKALHAELLASGIYDAENLAFDQRGRLFVSAGDYLYMIVPDKDIPGRVVAQQALDLKAIFAGLALGPDGFLYVACYSKFKTRILRIDIHGDVPPFPYLICLEGEIKTPNGLRFDDDGILYAADFGLYVPGSGKIMKIEAGRDESRLYRKATPIVTGLWGPNGIVMDRGKGRLYFTETFSGKIFYLERMDQGTYNTHPKLLINVAMPGPRFPILDDLALDASGNLYVCHYNGNQILVISPEGKLINKIVPEGLNHPTALAFAVTDEDEAHLYITQKGHMLIRDSRSGDCLSRITYHVIPYRLPFLDLIPDPLP